MAKILKLSTSAQNLIDNYANLKLGTKKIQTPYFINDKRKKAKRALVGKGTPAEIEDATQKLAVEKGFNLKNSSKQEIRNFMLENEIGVDCSGFVVWVLDEITKATLHKHVWQVIDFNEPNLIKKTVKRYLRPVENISANLITSNLNSIHITNLNDVKPGDLIRTRGGQHVLIITEVGFDDRDNLIYFIYFNSTCYYEDLNGVRGGRVEIKQPSGYLIEQEWIDNYNNRNWTYEGVQEKVEDNRIVRLKALSS